MFARIHVKYHYTGKYQRNWHEVWFETDVGSAMISHTREGNFDKEYSRSSGADKAFKKAKAIQRRTGLPIFFSEHGINVSTRAHRWKGDHV